MEDLFSLFRRARKPEPIRSCGAVVLAAGSAQRMGFDKMTVMLDGVPVLIRAISSFEHSPLIDEIVVVTRADRLNEIADLCSRYQMKKVTAVVSGGKTRTESALAGVMALKTDPALTAIHDGARPFVSQELIERALERASIQYAAVPVIRSTDTLREVNDKGTLTANLDREHVVRIQTPQVFLTDLVKGALTDAVQREMSFTDDATAVERLGVAIQSVPGEEDNIKLTTPQDLAVAEEILKRRREAGK